MLTQVKIDNFRSIRQTSVPLRPLTVLIGPNDSGKTTFLNAIQSLVTGRRGFDPSDFWRNDRSCEISIQGYTPSGEILAGSHERYIPSEGRTRQLLVPIQRFQLPSSGVAMQCAGYSAGQESELTIEEDGSRVPALLDYLLRRDRKRFFSIVQALREQIPGFDDLEIATPNPDQRQVVFSIERGLTIRADAASTGARLLLFFISIAYHPRPPRTILIEEPETGLHPKRLASAMQLMRDLTTGRYGQHPAQIILTTHSPYLLDSVDLTKDQVLVFRRNDDGSRSATPVDQERLREFLDEFKLGEVWFNEEEAGLVAKP